ncbi:MAG TPA: cytochrome c oxidase subunit 3 [Longimicrobiaceae bacterium]|nr:cytochrome c oxidase subunit 3 [Longimicrobiaceae bacterium]
MAYASTASGHAAHPAQINSSTGLASRKLAFWTFIGAECLIFGGMIGTYLAYKGNSISGPYPHEILNIPLTSFSAFVLLMSSLTMVLGLGGVQRADQKSATTWIFATAALGLLFVGIQIYEFTHFYHQGLRLGTNLFGSSFFVLTGLHGAHVAFGVLWLATLGLLSMRGKLGPERSLSVEIAGLYWHFVDVVWIVIFALIYLVQ